MNQKPASIRWNFIMNAILSMSSMIFPLITFKYVSEILGPDGTGKVSFATSLIDYFMLFAKLGIPTYGIRACAQVRDNRLELTRTVHELMSINMVMSVVTYVALFLALWLVPRLQADRTLYIVVSVSIFLNAIGMEWLYKALEQYTYITVRSIIFKAIGLVGMFFLVKEEKDYVIYGGITIFASSASNLFNFINAHKYVAMRPVGGYNFRRHFKEVGVFFAMTCATTIYTNLDTVMLGVMKTDTDVGYYHAAIRIKTILLSIVTSLGTVLLPRVSYYVQTGKLDEFHRISKKAINFVFLLACPMTLYFILFARQGIYFLSNSSYNGAIVPMQIIMPTLLIVGLTNIMGIQMLVPLGKERLVLRSQIAGAITDLVLNLILIPKYAAAGAAFGTVMAEIAVFIVQIIALRKELLPAYRDIHYFRILGALAVGTVASLWVLKLGLGSFLTLAISAVCFFGSYGLILLVVREPLVVEMVGQVLEVVFARIDRRRAARRRP